MKLKPFPLIVLVTGLAACGTAGNPSTTGDRVDGPNVKTLSHDQLMDVIRECHRYGSSDDPRVKYTISYCSAAQSAHAMEGYAKATPAAVDPTINKMH